MMQTVWNETMMVQSVLGHLPVEVGVGHKWYNKSRDKNRIRI